MTMPDPSLAESQRHVLSGLTNDFADIPTIATRLGKRCESCGKQHTIGPVLYALMRKGLADWYFFGRRKTAYRLAQPNYDNKAAISLKTARYA